ncbi:sterol O-acyltransferase 1 [Andrena cerasifolii]|uniref:sterol O-acyltransferase 1 n=1 Tax=Andrena cerasifolii TaxID=2819439 RepID=UPI0040381337
MMDRCKREENTETKSLTVDGRIGDGISSESGEDFKKHGMEYNDTRKLGIRDLIGNELKTQMKEMRHDILERVNNRMNDMVSEIMQSVDKMTCTESKDLVDSEKYCNRRKPTRGDVLPPKQFLTRNSLLTDLYEIKHIRTIYNLIISILIILLIHTTVYDIRQMRSPTLALGTIRRGFSKLPIVLSVWSLMKCSTLAVYTSFCFWASRRLGFSPKSLAIKIWDYSWLVTIILYQIMFIALPMKTVITENLPVGSSLIILMEQMRFVMKTHAFIRSEAPRFLSHKPHTDMPIPKPADFSKYLYFLFAPTLIYQDNYPRTRKIRWNIVLVNFAEVLTVLLFVATIYERMIEPSFVDFGKQPVEFGMLALNILDSIMPGILLFVCGFYLLLHSWMNAFAELLRFADKMFYKDWWNSVCFSDYFRTWNIVVHDWLYTYIYKDMYEIVVPRNKPLATCMVFAISSIFHEYLLCVAFRFFFPVMLLLFGGIGLIAVFVLKSAGNVFLWFSLCLGSGVLTSLYCMEHFARINCPPARDDFLDLVLPRIWTCTFQ